MTVFGKLFPAQNHTDVFPAAVYNDEEIELMREPLPCDHHAKIVGMSEVGLRHIAGLRRLMEDDVSLWLMQRPPLPYPPLQGAPVAIIGESQRMQALKMAQQGDGLKGAVP